MKASEEFNTPKRNWPDRCAMLGAGAVLATVVFLVAAHPARADTLDELKKSIDQKNEEIKKLEEEAQQYRQEIAARQGTALSLQGELSGIDRTLGQLKRGIALTQKKISEKELEIEETALQIKTKEGQIGRMRRGLGGMLQSLSESDRQSLTAALAGTNGLSGFFQMIDYTANVQDKMLRALGSLRQLRQELADQKSQDELKKGDLEALNAGLAGRKKIQEAEHQNRAILLRETKNQEKQYTALLQDREARRTALADEVRQIEEKIQVTIDPSLLPRKGTGVLGWPLPNISLGTCRLELKQDALTNCITQFFGYTSFAAIGGYNGKGHNGADFRAEIGTPVLSADDGDVTATGDTDAGCRAASYGKWILIRHPNNLSTLYGHLSLINVSAGQGVKRGEQIGYSGKTGYATGPHLHFSVFATQAVQVQDIRSRVCGRTMTLPVSAINGYLNPLDYL